MEPIIKKTLEKTKIELKNYCATKHNFFDIFPEDEYDFSGKDYTHYFYFDREEAQCYFEDYCKFIVRNYQINMFRIDNYYSVIEQFAKYLEKHHVFYNNRTMVGISMSVKNNLALFKILKALQPSLQVNDPEKPVIFAFGEVDDKPYTLPFFDYLEQKLDGYQYLKKYVVEPLVDEDLATLSSIFKGVKYVGDPLFIVNPNYKNVKLARNKIMADFIGTGALKTWCISYNGVIVAFANIVPDEKLHKLNILCNSEHYDLDFKNVVEYISIYAFENLGVSKLVCFNDNVEMSYSAVNSSLTIAGFKPNYLSETGERGYSKIEYSLNKADYEFKKIEPNKSIIKFSF